jgi:galactokinase/mevalonate kinase-like predicted kinase
MKKLISLPPAMADHFPRTPEGSDWFAASDPRGSKLGSGGGIVHLLDSARRASNPDTPLTEWLSLDLHLALMAGGQSRRLPAYAATGKILMPFPVLRWSDGQRLDQTLLDMQLPGLEAVAAQAHPSSRVMVASGDVLLRFPPSIPKLPEADIVCLGMWVDEHTASDFGVFFTKRESPSQLDFFLQKPAPERIAELAADHLFLVDTGLWLLGPKALEVLFANCGWDPDRNAFRNGHPDFHELYAGMGPRLGANPVESDPSIGRLTCAVAPLPDARFLHFGTSRQMIESVTALQNLNPDQRDNSPLALKPHREMHILNSSFAFSSRSRDNAPLWIENCQLPDDMEMASANVLTNIPGTLGRFALEPGICVDTPPVGDTAACLRVYGFDDPFKGAIDEPATLFLGESAGLWFARLGLDPSSCGIDPSSDIQNARLFPVVEPDIAAARLLEWMTAPKTDPQDPLARRWREARRLSAQEITEFFAPARLLDQRRQRIAEAAPVFHAHRARNPFTRLDLDHTAQFFASPDAGLQSIPPAGEDLQPSETMFFSRVAALRGDGKMADRLESDAFRQLADRILEANAPAPSSPRRKVVEDQIVWGRSPVRIDLAGGWSDTPPYCLARGGSVINVAIDLNGQPPVQVFARATASRHIVIRSIDLGAGTTIDNCADLEDFNRVGAEFSLAKAALALAGFHPRFAAAGPSSLDEILENFGGGLEITMLAATPKGSGLGTSSILGATLLGTLSEVCGLDWTREDISARTLALEQLLTTGGGWQDQAGGIFRGLKMIETAPGPAQHGSVRWLPERVPAQAMRDDVALLYYTGITRVAKSILAEIVRGMFLNRHATMRLLDAIAAHAHSSFDLLQKESWEGLCEVVDTTWKLNRALDAGTDPPPVRDILRRVADWTAAAKLPGAGGGGYLLLLAKDQDAAARIRAELTRNPPNPNARFVDMAISDTGLQITRS